MKNLKNLREKIDEIDFLIIELLSERFDVVKEIWDVKKKNWVENPFDEKRWKEVLERNAKKAEEIWISKDFIEKIWEEIHKESLKIEK